MPLPSELLTEEEMIFELHQRVRRRGDQKRVAHELGVGQGSLSNLLTAGRAPGKELAAALGYRRRVYFERIR
jgi:hypothetical protein